MKTIITLAIALVLAISLTQGAWSAGGAGSDDTESSPSPSRDEDPDYASGVKAVKARDWSQAVTLLQRAVQNDAKSADANNYLAYAYRQSGDLDNAFKHYTAALSLNPKHLGAHEYIGEAYLKTGNLGKAEEHLAVLDDLCFFGCEEFDELKEAIAAYKAKNS